MAIVETSAHLDGRLDLGKALQKRAAKAKAQIEATTAPAPETETTETTETTEAEPVA